MIGHRPQSPPEIVMTNSPNSPACLGATRYSRDEQTLWARAVVVAVAGVSSGAAFDLLAHLGG
jgi:hypothetical protein